MKGRYYVTSCPGDVIFNTVSRECGFTSPGASPPVRAPPVRENNGGSPGGNSQDSSNHGLVTPLPAVMGNPCTPQALAKNKYYHKYASNKTK